MIDNTFPIKEPLIKPDFLKKLGFNNEDRAYGLHPDRIDRLARLKDDTIVVVNEQTWDRFSYRARLVKKFKIYPIPRDLYVVPESVLTKLEPEVEPESGSEEEYYKFFA